MRRICALLTTTALVSIALTSAPALAQDAADAERYNEIVVTATKREESLQDIPISVSVLSAETLTNNRVQSLSDVARLTPGLEIGNGFGRQTSYVSIRGVGPQTFNAPTVITFVDGFTSGLRTDVSGEIFDLERVEVLKGPQATLYGRNAIGGTINYVTRRPSAEWGGRLEASYGNYDAYTLRGSVTGPLAGETLTFRMSGSAIGRDGYYDNVIGGVREENVDSSRDRSGRLALRLAPPDSDFEANLAVSYSESRDGCGDCTQSIVGYSNANPQILATRTLDENDLDGVFNTDFLGGFDREVLTAVMSVEGDLGSVRFNSISGYTNVSGLLSLDFNRAPGPLFFGPVPVTSGRSDITTDVLSQELRLSSDTASKFQWILGGYYYYSRDYNIGFLDTPFFPIQTSDGITTRDNYALFFDGTYQLSERLKLGFGLRYDVEDSLYRSVLNNDLISTRDTEWLPRATILWDATPDFNLYATVSRGYKSGGVNPAAFGSVPPQRIFGPEFVWNYEIGLKGGASGLTYELAGFYIDWTDQQVTSTVPGGITSFIDNAGRTRIYGAEGQFRYVVSDKLTVAASAAWTNARYSDFVDQSGVPGFYGFPAQRAGERPLLAPDFSGAASVEYVEPLSDNWDITARVNGRYTGRQSIDNSGIIVAGNYATSDASLSVGTDNLRVTLFANNLFDREYAAFAQLFAGFQPLIRPGVPRTYGVQFAAEF